MSGGKGAGALDAAWLRAHPLPSPPEGTDKNSRGRVVVVGGSPRVPGGLLLTAEAALRAGAGKVQMALPAPLSIPAGIAMPEAGVLPLPVDDRGEIAGLDDLADEIADTDCLAIGPALVSDAVAEMLLDALLPAVTDAVVVLDAAALAAAATRHEAIAALPSGAVLTPHLGEMARLTGLSTDEISARCAEVARDTARTLRAVIVLKGPTTTIAGPDGRLMVYAGGGVGLATGGSGDVLAGIIAGLCARGLSPWEAACWAVWLHGEAGRRLAENIGPIGFLARDLPGCVPGLMRAV